MQGGCRVETPQLSKLLKFGFQSIRSEGCLKLGVAHIWVSPHSPRGCFNLDEIVNRRRCFFQSKGACNNILLKNNAVSLIRFDYYFP